MKRAKLLTGLLDGERAYTGPFYADIDVTRRCNMRCLGCPYQSSKTRGPTPGDHSVKDLDLEILDKIIRGLVQLKTPEVFLCGEGEPMLHPQLTDIIAALKQAGLKVQLFTNGTLFNEKYAKKLLDSGLDVLRISLWATTPQEFEKLYPGARPEQLDEIITGIKVFTRVKAENKLILPLVILNQPLNSYNFRNIDKRIELAHETGCNGVVFDTYRDWHEFGQAALSPKQVQRLCQDLIHARKQLELNSLSHNIDDVLTKFNLEEDAWRKSPCYVGWYFTRIRVDGTVVPCPPCAMSMGNLTSRSLVEIWNGAEYRRFRRKTSIPGGSEIYGDCCDCNWCHYVKDNYRVYRLFRWIKPHTRKKAPVSGRKSMDSMLKSLRLRVKGGLNQFRGRATQAVKRLLLITGLVPPPFRIQIDITDQCNFCCPTCSKWREPHVKQELTLHEWQSVLKKIGTLPVLREISISGGEPFLRPDLFEILRFAKQQHLRIVLISNGWNISRDVLKELQHIGVDCLIVSLNSLHASVHDKSRNQPGSHRQLMQCIDDWRSLPGKMRFCLETVVTEANCGELSELAQFVEKMELGGILFQVLAPHQSHYSFSGNQVMAPSAYDWFVKEPSWIKDYEALRREINTVLKMQKEGIPILNPPDQLRRFPLYYEEPDKVRKVPCLGTLSRMYIDPYGDIRICYGFPPVGNIIRDDPKRLWKSKQAQRIRKEATVCSRLCRMLNNNL